MNTPKFPLIAAPLNLSLAIALGAFGAHALRDRISEQALDWFKTGHNYHMWLALALIALLAWPNLQPKTKSTATTLTLIGTLLFSGSLYLMAITDLRILGAITPLGGATWIATFIYIAIASSKTSQNQS